MTLQAQFVPRLIAEQLKDLGFDDPCFSKFERYFDKTKIQAILATTCLNGPYKLEYNGYDQKIINSDEHYAFTGYKNSVKDHGDEVVTAVIWQQAVDFLRTKYGMHVDVFPDYDVEDKTYRTSWNVNVVDICWGEEGEQHVTISIRDHDLTYEAAREKGVKAALILLKEQRDHKQK